MAGFVAQTAILWGILFFQPWFGDLAGEAKLVAAGAAALIGSGILFFLWDLYRAPMEIFKTHRDFIKELSEAIIETQDKDAAIKGLSDRHAKGVAILRENSANWREQLEAWEAEFNVYLQKYFDSALVHELISSYVIGWNKKEGNTTYINKGTTRRRHDDDVSYFEYYAEKLNNINSRIPYCEMHYRGNTINSLIFAETAIRQYGLPEHRLPKGTET